MNMLQNVNEDRYNKPASVPHDSNSPTVDSDVQKSPPLNLLQVAERTDLNYWWLRRMCSTRRIAFTKVGREYCLTADQITAAQAKRRIVIETDGIPEAETERPPARNPVRKTARASQPRRSSRSSRAPRPPRTHDPADDGFVVTDAILGPDELNTYADRLTLDVGEGCIYVAFFVTGMVKVGRSHRPFTRIRQHASEAERHENPVVRAWISMPHTEFIANERALKTWAMEHGELINGAEYFHAINSDDIISFALTLPATPAVAPIATAGSAGRPGLAIEPDLGHPEHATQLGSIRFQQGVLELDLSAGASTTLTMTVASDASSPPSSSTQMALRPPTATSTAVRKGCSRSPGLRPVGGKPVRREPGLLTRTCHDERRHAGHGWRKDGVRYRCDGVAA